MPVLPSGQAINRALAAMILSPSGWRGVFAPLGEESPGAEPDPALSFIAASGALVFAEYLSPGSGACGSPLVILGMDTRPTGKALAETMAGVFLAAGCELRFLGVSAAPEIMAYTRLLGSGKFPVSNTGFCYISASHNPIGHNGLKFGLADGGVLPGPEAEKLITSLKAFWGNTPKENAAAAEKIARLLDAGKKDISTIYSTEPKFKQEALEAYSNFSLELIAGQGEPGKKVMKALARGLEQNPLGIAVDFNGSARSASIDGELFRSLKIKIHILNGKPGEIAHAIIPEGDSLEPCRRFLEDMHRSDPSVLLGYVPDCDGDRGNLVIWDDRKGGGRALLAQEVFALSCAAELAHLVWTGEKGPVAVAVNGPTSLRIDRIAASFGAKIFRAEVGEANVVNLARELRDRGYVVRILGEGSNGGSITHPSAVRDPLATVFALIKLLAVTDGMANNGSAEGGFFDIWRRAAAKTGTKSNFTLADITASLPHFTTTGVSTPEAKLEVVTGDHALLKDRYQKIFLAEWETKKEELKRRWGIWSWEARACIGTKELRNISRFGDAGTGGLKIVFQGRNVNDSKSSAGKGPGEDAAFIWMRGSKTEPVFRIMADAETEELERELIQWQRAMVQKADAG